ncbi:MAG: hypothetical protein INH41_24965, partial [Myxococcaceae bacterium]|nr:hypothetical protein [Myxococcaceae bacterium]
MRTSPPVLLAFALAVSCAAPRPVLPANAAATATPPPVAAPALASPGLRLPEGARPLGYQLELTVVPGQDRFSGVITAQVEV